jgi:hypothetical protein
MLSPVCQAAVIDQSTARTLREAASCGRRGVVGRRRTGSGETNLGDLRTLRTGPHLTVEQRQLALRPRTRDGSLREVGAPAGSHVSNVALIVSHARGSRSIGSQGEWTVPHPRRTPIHGANDVMDRDRRPA